MEYLFYILIVTSIFSIAAMALSLTSGYTGLISVAEGAFMGLGAYTVAIFLTVFHFNFLLAMLLGILLSAVVGCILGFVFSKLSGDYFVLGTVGFTMIIYSLGENLGKITRGPLGIPGIPPPSFFNLSISTPLSFMIFSMVVFGLSYLVFSFIVKSSFGRVLKAIREDEEALKIFGYSSFRFRLVVFVIASIFGAIAGGLFATYFTFINPESFSLTLSIFILTAIIIGGLDSVPGVLLGTFILVLTPELLRFIGFSSDMAAQMRELIYGLILIFFMLYKPNGILGKYKIK